MHFRTTLHHVWPAIGALLLSLVPVPAFAQPATVTGFICIFIDLLDLVLLVLSSAAVVVFLWGLFSYVARADQQDAIKKAKFLMSWGILALFVLVSMWGILRFAYMEAGLYAAEPFGTFLLPTGEQSTGAVCTQ